MIVLTYRGKKYFQHKDVAPKENVELSYRRNVYKSRKSEAKKHIETTLTYRGTKYQR